MVIRTKLHKNDVTFVSGTTMEKMEAVLNQLLVADNNVIQQVGFNSLTLISTSVAATDYIPIHLTAMVSSRDAEP